MAFPAFTQNLPTFPPLSYCLIPCLMHLISLWFQATAPEVCTELVSSLISFGSLGSLKMENLICSDSLFKSFSPWIEVYMPLDSLSPQTNLVGALSKVPVLCFHPTLPPQQFSLLCFPWGKVPLMSIETVTPSIPSDSLHLSDMRSFDGLLVSDTLEGVQPPTDISLTDYFYIYPVTVTEKKV